MINKEMQKALETLGLTAEETKKVLESSEAKKITEITAKARNADQAIAAITKEFPNLDAEALKAQFNETIAKSEEEKLSAPKELTGDALASVAGGSEKETRETIAYILGGIATVALIGGVAAGAVAGYRAQQNAGAGAGAGGVAGNAGAGAGGADNLSVSSATTSSSSSSGPHVYFVG